MTTKPEPTKGVPRIEDDPTPSLRADHNALADWVRDNVDAALPTVGDLPQTGNWPGRRIYVTAADAVYAWKGSAVGWARVGPQSRLMSWFTTGGGSGSYKYAGDVAPIIRMGQAAGTTSGTGVLSTTFDVAFPNGISTVVLTPHQNTGALASSMPVLVEGGLSKTGFQSFWGGKANTQVFLPYVAFGY